MAEILSTRFSQMSAFYPEATEWNQQLNKLFKDYINYVLGEDTETAKTEEELIKYFEEVINPSKIVARRGESGVIIEGIEEIL